MGWKDTEALLEGRINWAEFCRRNPNNPLSAIAVYAREKPYAVAYFIRSVCHQRQKLNDLERILLDKIDELGEKLSYPPWELKEPDPEEDKLNEVKLEAWEEVLDLLRGMK